MATLETPRTLLRRFNLSDLQNMVELESNPEIMKFTPSRVPQTLEQTRLRLESQIQKQSSLEPLGVWAVELKNSQDFVGWFMLMKRNEDFPELGFMIVQRHWNQGYATEVAQRLIDYGFKQLGYSGIVATTNQDNRASKNVLSKLGFIFSQTVIRFDTVMNQEIQLDQFKLVKTMA